MHIAVHIWQILSNMKAIFMTYEIKPVMKMVNHNIIG